MVDEKKSLWGRFKRLVRYRLIVPLKRSVHSPELVARGTGVGLAWAFTPLVGIQMWLVFMTWVVCRRLKWDFSLPLGLAWTWVTNVFTLPPVYYGFYVTGKIMRGRWGDISGYESASHTIRETFLGELTTGEKWGMIFDLLVKDWGVSMIIGSLPWALIFGVGGYYATLKFMREYQAMRAARIQKKREANARAEKLKKTSKRRARVL